MEVRLDSATGPLVGETAMIRQTADSLPASYRATLQASRGVHDLYLVIHNEAAPAPARSLLVLLTATFENAARTGAGIELQRLQPSQRIRAGRITNYSPYLRTRYRNSTIERSGVAGTTP